MFRSQKRRSAMRRAFTLIEVLLVVMIIAVIAGLAIRNLFTAQDTANANAASAQISNLESSCNQYKLVIGSFPPSLDALYKEPSSVPAGKTWQQMINKPVPADPWGNEYEYKVDGTGVVIRSAGVDGQMNSDDDITNIPEE